MAVGDAAGVAVRGAAVPPGRVGRGCCATGVAGATGAGVGGSTRSTGGGSGASSGGASPPSSDGGGGGGGGGGCGDVDGGVGD